MLNFHPIDSLEEAGVLPKGNKMHFMTSFPQRSTHQASPYLSRFSVLTLGVTIVLPGT